eukprot:Unigene1788_Nuclearia_a/m.5565 Unigene1788_Nuclearia_a/g.5565  ORF Unigene1788_Nuclearia_a/g.5565 Unigene1788_Nuclearia_a/m.5565 type:complete len:155 (-) Unigene1788_Nuclearia_a:1259-1723(-)
MEHTVLMQVLEQVGPVLTANGLKLGVVVDGDLETNNTLRSSSLVGRVFLDLPHKLKNAGLAFDRLSQRHPARPLRDQAIAIFGRYVRDAPKLGRTDADVRDFIDRGLVEHFAGVHGHCWREICIHAGAPLLRLAKPNLLRAGSLDRERQRSRSH